MLIDSTMAQVLRDSRTRYITLCTTPKTTQSIEIPVESLFDVNCFQQICSSVESFIKIDDFKLFCEGKYSTKSTDEVKGKYKLTQQFDKVVLMLIFFMMRVRHIF